MIEEKEQQAQRPALLKPRIAPVADSQRAIRAVGQQGAEQVRLLVLGLDDVIASPANPRAHLSPDSPGARRVDRTDRAVFHAPVAASGTQQPAVIMRRRRTVELDEIDLELRGIQPLEQVRQKALAAASLGQVRIGDQK